ncbi:MAG: YbjQ family protein [Nanoarchaeota archaeon]|nr:YbjQ family protein [Nanoarchaeota archaeon]
MKEIIVTTATEIPGKKVVKILGVVRGNTVRARNIGRDIGAGFKNIIGGEIKTYTEMISQSRDEAYNRMVNQAIEIGADAVIGFRFMTSMIMAGASEMLAYGTAVKLK